MARLKESGCGIVRSMKIGEVKLDIRFSINKLDIRFVIVKLDI